MHIAVKMMGSDCQDGFFIYYCYAPWAQSILFNYSSHGSSRCWISSLVTQSYAYVYGPEGRQALSGDNGIEPRCCASL